MTTTEMMLVGYIVAVGAVSALTWPAQKPPPQPAIPMVTRAMAQEVPAYNPTFEQRWTDAIEDLKAVAPRHVPLSIEPLPRTVQTIKVIPLAPTKIEPPEVNVEEPKLLQPVTRSIRKSNNRADVCQRVGKRKVMVGKYKWRCR